MSLARVAAGAGTGSAAADKACSVIGRGTSNACTFLLLLFAAANASAALPTFATPGPDEMRAHFIDVGQGSAVLLEFSCGVALIDTGGEVNGDFHSTTRLQRYLDAFFARRPDRDETIDLLLITHAHIDHTRGLPMILRRYTVRSLVDNGLEKGSGGRQQKAAHRIARERGIKHASINERDVSSPRGLTSAIIDPIPDPKTCTATDPRFFVLWGALDARRGWDSKTLANGNASSVVLRVVFGNASFLFPGDLEEEVQPELVDFFTAECSAGQPARCPLDVDVYHVSHHGSHNGTTVPFMAAMSPKLAVISMGPRERSGTFSALAFGHPRVATINTLMSGAPDRTPDLLPEATRFALGVQQTRPTKLVPIANRGRSKKPNPTPQFIEREMSRGIYGTGWDGTVVVTARASGELKVDIEN